MCFQSLVAARMTLQGRLAKIYLDIAQVNEMKCFSFFGRLSHKIPSGTRVFVPKQP